MIHLLLNQTPALRASASRSFTRAAAAVRPHQSGADLVESDVNLKVLSSPLRRCILTQKVLPKQMMVQLKLARMPDSGGLILTPSSILHPRFSAPMSGKGAWVMCWKDAVDALAAKGSYKRIASATMPPITSLKIHSQLARRIGQEVVMLVERVKSRPAFLEGGRLRPCPIRRIGEDAGQVVEGMTLVAVLDFARAELGTNGAPPSPSSSPPVSTYRLSSFLDTAQLPSPSVSASSDTPTDLITSIRSALDDLMSVFARRSSRLPTTELDSCADGSAQVADEADAATLYAIYAPNDSAEAVMAREDLVPLLLALYRMQLWQGQGWE